jgi:hypothetical protein
MGEEKGDYGTDSCRFTWMGCAYDTLVTCVRHGALSGTCRVPIVRIDSVDLKFVCMTPLLLHVVTHCLMSHCGYSSNSTYSTYEPSAADCGLIRTAPLMYYWVFPT